MAVSIEPIEPRTAFHPLTVAEHSGTRPLVLVEGCGARLRDRRGNESIDGLAGR